MRVLSLSCPLAVAADECLLERVLPRMKHSILAVVVSIGLLAAACQSISADLADVEIRQILIQESINSYSGNCPCPYNRASNGSRCGKRSAYSRPGGATPLCYESDVTDAMIDRYRKRIGK